MSAAERGNSVVIFIPSPKGICCLRQLMKSEGHQCLCGEKQRGPVAGGRAEK